jgi:arsenite methyltransferase
VQQLPLANLNTVNGEPLNVEAAVRERYSAASRQKTPELCCPVQYDRRYLDVLPPELIERDYGCGDPSRHVRPGETVLDLGSGGGKICYIAAQVVGPAGRVIGVDANDDMLALARKYQQEIGDRLGYHNVTFHKGRIQDLALDLDVFERYLAERPVRSSSDWLLANEHADHLRQARPMIAGESIDVIVSNCVLNLIRREDRRQLFSEMFRVLKPSGRAVISDITCDRPVPARLQQDATLWSGCISGAFVEEEFLAAFAAAGFRDVRVLDRQAQAWATIECIEFRSMTVEAFKDREGTSEGQAHEHVQVLGKACCGPSGCC